MDNKNLEYFVELINEKLHNIWREVFTSPHFTIKEKSGFRDIVTTLDIEVENKIKDFLNDLLPEAGFIGEETSFAPAEKLNWVIDPIDGTTNFSKSNPHFSTQIALTRGQEVFMGVIYDPNLDEFFHAIKGKGSYLNGERIESSNADTIKKASIHTGLQYASEEAYERQTKRLCLAIKECRGLRVAGSACLDLAYVACGRADVYWEESIKPWDVAAGTLIVSEAGGKIESCINEPFDLYNPNILATNGNADLIREAKEIILF